MKNIVVVTFTGPSKAYEALSTLKNLSASERLVLQLAVVVERQANGQPVVREHTNAMDLLGEPAGLVGDLVDGLAGTSESAAIAERIPSGTTGLIAEVYEYAVEVIDGEMGRLGGVVAREDVDVVKAELKAAKDARHSAQEQAKREERESHRREHERERAERHNERLDRVEHWLEGRKEPVPPAAEAV